MQSGDLSSFLPSHIQVHYIPFLTHSDKDVFEHWIILIHSPKSSQWMEGEGGWRGMNEEARMKEGGGEGVSLPAGQLVLRGRKLEMVGGDPLHYSQMGKVNNINAY